MSPERSRLYQNMMGMKINEYREENGLIEFSEREREYKTKILREYGQQFVGKDVTDERGGQTLRVNGYVIGDNMNGVWLKTNGPSIYRERKIEMPPTLDELIDLLIEARRLRPDARELPVYVETPEYTELLSCKVETIDDVDESGDQMVGTLVRIVA